MGPPATGWVGGVRNIGVDGRFSATGHDARAERHLLLPVLHAIQSREGWISPGALNYACQRLDVPPAEAFGVASFYGLFSMKQRPPVVTHVCDDIACLTRGAGALCEEMERKLGPPGTPSPDGPPLRKQGRSFGDQLTPMGRQGLHAEPPRPHQQTQPGEDTELWRLLQQVSLAVFDAGEQAEGRQQAEDGGAAVARRQLHQAAGRLQQTRTEPGALFVHHGDQTLRIGPD